MVKTIDAKGITTQIQYDNYSNIIQVVHALGTLQESKTLYTYDDVGNKLSEQKGQSSTFYSYDPLNRIVETTRDTISSKNVYDIAGNVIEIHPMPS